MWFVINSKKYIDMWSTILVSKLKLYGIKHNIPYKLKLLNDYIELKVIKQVLVMFSIEKYVDGVLYDVFSMHVLLVRPWKFDRKFKHDGFKKGFF